MIQPPLPGLAGTENDPSDLFAPPDEHGLVTVIEVDQWSSTADNIEEMTLDDFDPDRLHGGDSEAAKAIFGGHFRRREVEEDTSPTIAHVWFRPTLGGKLKHWKHRYDSSD